MPNVGWEDFSKFGSSLYLCGHGSVSHHASSLGDIQQNSHQNRSAYVDELIESVCHLKNSNVYSGLIWLVLIA